MFHLSYMIKYHVQSVCTSNVKCKGITPTLDDATCGGANAITLVWIIQILGFVCTCIGKYLQWEVMLNSSHRSTEHTFVGLIIFITCLHKELVLQPVGKVYKTIVKNLFDVGNIFLGNAHPA